MTVKEDIIELLYKAKGVDNSEIENIADEVLSIIQPKKDCKSLIESEIIRKFGYSFNELTTKSRLWKFSYPRNLAAYLLNKYNSHPYTESAFKDIAGILGRNRTTIRHSIDVICDFIDTDKEIRNTVKEMERNIDEQL